MFKISSTLAGVATLALATVPMLAIASGAHAAPVVVKISDIDTSSAEGAKKQRSFMKVTVSVFASSSERRFTASKRRATRTCIEAALPS